MVVLIKKYPNNETTISDRIDCDKVHQAAQEDNIHLVLYKNDRIIHDELFTEKTKVFFMENGKTIDSISFKVNPK